MDRVAVAAIVMVSLQRADRFGNVSGRERTNNELAETTDRMDMTGISIDPILFENPVRGITCGWMSRKRSKNFGSLISGRTMKIVTIKKGQKVDEEHGLLPGLYVVQPLRNTEIRKPQRLVIE